MNRANRGPTAGAAIVAAATMAFLLGANDAAAGGYGGVGAWQAARPLTEINTVDGEGCPIETQDGLSLMFASTRPGGSGNLDVWVADRERIGDGWQPPRAVPLPINSESNDLCPTPVGRNLYFVSDRPLDGGCGGGDILVSRQSPAGDWSEPDYSAVRHTGPTSAGPNAARPSSAPTVEPSCFIQAPAGRVITTFTSAGNARTVVLVPAGSSAA